MNGATTIAAQKITYAYLRLHETLDGQHGPLTHRQAAELSEATRYLADTHHLLTGETIGHALGWNHA